MKKNNLFKRIISIVFIVLIFLFTPILGYIQGNNYFCYAVTENILKESSKAIVPLVGYMFYSVNKTTSNIVANDLANSIEKAKIAYEKYFNNLTVAQKVYLGNAFTTYTLDELNHVYGTSYSQSTVDSWGVNELKAKILNNETLTPYELQKLGITDLMAYTYKDSISNNIDYGEIYQKGSINVKVMDISQQNYWVKDFADTENIFNFFSVPVEGTSSHVLSDTTYNWYLRTNQSYIFQTDSFYKVTIYAQTYTKDGSYRISTPIENCTPYGTTFSMNFNWTIQKLVNGTWTTLTSRTGDSNDSNTSFITSLRDFCSVDFTSTNFYGRELSQTFDYTWRGTGIRFGLNDAYDFTVIAPTAGLLNEVPDTSITAAEAIIAAINALGDNIQDLPYEISKYSNPENDDEEIIINDPTTGLGVDTGSPVEDIPDTSGDLGNGTINIPILGSILAWLKSLVELVRRILEHILNNPGSSADEGTDWGNFKGFFDIFYIFYYLIILAIIILVKFFSVIISILSIPPNKYLFDNYPTMLDGLNYLKNLKIGGFSITLQQIFEYMFTVFFFLYIVTTLQKLYHSFSGIERQQIRANEREARLASYEESSHYAPTNFVAVKNEVDRREELENITIKDYTKGW